MKKENSILTVLSVDDSEVIYANLNYLLNDINGLKWIAHAFTIEDAIEIINKNKPDVVLLDIKIKDRNGFELLEYLKQNFNEITTIMLSNFTTKPYIKKSFELGAKYFLDKSQEFEKLNQIFIEILNTKKYK